MTCNNLENEHFAFGGQSPILIYSPSTGKVTAINGIGTAPRLATPEFYVQQGGITRSGILSGTIPPMPGAAITALDLFGTRSFAEVAQPAIEYADGFPMVEYIRESYLEGEKNGSIREPTIIKLMKPNGRLPAEGEIFSQSDLARTLRTLVETEKRNLGKGRHAALMAVKDEFYKGSIAREIVRFHEANGGLHRMEDYINYETKVVPALSVKYKEYEIFKNGTWTQGPALLEMLNMLEGIDLKAMGQFSSDYAHVLIETIKLAMADRDHYYGDPDFSDIPLTGLLSKEYAAERRKQIDMKKANLTKDLQGDPFKFQPKKTALIRSAPAPLPADFNYIHPGGVEGTTCINVGDKYGNLVSITPSCPTGYPTPVMGNTGVIMNSRMGQFILDPTVNPYNVVAPGKRPRTTLTPSIVLKNGKPFMAISTPGTEKQEQTILQVFLNIVEFGMNPQEAVEAPRLEVTHLMNSGQIAISRVGGVNIESRFEKKVLDDLKGRGHVLKISSDYSDNSGATLVMYDTENRTLAGGSDIRRYRYGMGW